MASAEKALYRANEKLAVYDAIVREATNGKIANRIRIQQLADILERTNINLIEAEIAETVAGIDENAIDRMIEDVNQLETVLEGLEIEKV